MTCAKCGSKALIDDARIVDHSEYRRDDLVAIVPRKPQDWLDRGETEIPLHCRICASCGHVELFVPKVADYLTILKSDSDG